MPLHRCPTGPGPERACRLGRNGRRGIAARGRGPLPCSRWPAASGYRAPAPAPDRPRACVPLGRNGRRDIASRGRSNGWNWERLSAFDGEIVDKIVGSWAFNRTAEFEWFWICAVKINPDLAVQICEYYPYGVMHGKSSLLYYNESGEDGLFAGLSK